MSAYWVEVDPMPAAITPGVLWHPVSGEEAEAYLASRPQDARDRVRNEAQAILSRCVDPKGEPGRRAGLIVGFVQSGKTTSMAACAAMGRDNGFGLVILIAGTSKLLLEQSRARFGEALRLGESDRYRRWEDFPSPRPGGVDASRIAAALETWSKSTFADDRPTVLITVMKQTTHLQDLGEVLGEVSRLVDLRGVPALVFDDEADQASPNLRRALGAESATYRDLRRLRAHLPWHTFLQYTATPQALLLIDIADEISPDFTCVLEPGPDYVGGKHFFLDHFGQFVRIIPTGDLEAVDPATAEPPPSLLDSLAVFVVGATVSRIRRDSRPSQRSMLIHPSMEVAAHANFVKWTKAILDRWKVTLSLDDGDPDRSELVESQIAVAYADLQGSIGNLPSLEEIARHLPAVIGRIRLEEVNARGTKPPVINWSQAFAWVLVGGTLMDRGFTVEGLCVTYMPRGVGVGNADTLQQRARFFGYKRPYVDYCRAWLEADVASAFQAYVSHEESVRSQLIAQTNAGQSLREWRRQFLLDPRLQPTRRQVIRLPYDRPQLRGWILQDHLSAPDSNLNDENRTVVQDFLDGLILTPETGADPRRTTPQQHLVASVPLSELHERLLAPYVFYEGNAIEFRALQLLTGSLGDRDAKAVLYLMSLGKTRRRALLPDSTRIQNLMQGRNPTHGPAIYPGDREIHDPERLTVQVHWVDVLQADGRLAQSGVPALAVWVPDVMAADMLVER